MKKYLANTAISVSVTLPNGGNTRVSFSALTDGTSVYYTDDKEIQWALEHHYKFGKLFRLVGEDNAADNAPTPAKSSKKNTSKSPKKGTAKETPAETTDEAEATSEKESQEEAPELKEVSVTDLDAAKDYLAENFDVVRTKLKTEEIIKETALSYGITFNFA